MRALRLLGTLLASAMLYLLVWPTGVDPVAWTPPRDSGRDRVFQYNEALKGIQKLASGVGRGPASIDIDVPGQLYTGFADGRVVQFSPDGSRYNVLGQTGGRPLGIAFDPKGGLAVADGERGLLHLFADVEPLDGRIRVGLANGLDRSRTGKSLYFTDSSEKFGFGRRRRDFLEHGANGRLLVYDAETGQTRLLASGLHFANGVAAGPDDQYVLVAETSEYRILRYWLKGPGAGTAEAFIENLPGPPDDVTFNGRDRFWVGLQGLRDPLLEQLLADHSFLRVVLARLPAVILPQPPRHAFALALDLQGKVIANLQYGGPDAYAPVSSVRERGPWLYFGSEAVSAIGRLPLRAAIADAPAPPPGWEQVPESRPQFPQGSRESEEEEEERGQRR